MPRKRQREEEEESDDSSPEDICEECKKGTPKKTWDGRWVACDSCKKWFHSVCSGLKPAELTRLMTAAETAKKQRKEAPKWECRSCAKPETARQKKRRGKQEAVRDEKPWRWTPAEEQQWKERFNDFLTEHASKLLV
ncbi:hypothetical protein DIPPA_07225 [Diplonema papillatum]|nr:hypothetical protein DIPPA_07225 [Diplonema papillatum]